MLVSWKRASIFLPKSIRSHFSLDVHNRYGKAKNCGGKLLASFRFQFTPGNVSTLPDLWRWLDVGEMSRCSDVLIFWSYRCCWPSIPFFFLLKFWISLGSAASHSHNIMLYLYTSAWKVNGSKILYFSFNVAMFHNLLIKWFRFKISVFCENTKSPIRMSKEIFILMPNTLRAKPPMILEKVRKLFGPQPSHE